MPETVKLFGKTYPKKVVYGAGAVAAGVVGYAWFTKGRTTNGAEEEEEIDIGPVAPPTDEEGFDVIGGSGPPPTNAEWSELAKTRLINIGIDAIALSSAIGKFLARKPLNKVEADLVRQAISAAGYPPENGPWVIIEETTGGTTPTPTPTPTPKPTPKPAPKPTGVRPRTMPGFMTASSPHPGQVWIRFLHVPGATGYQWRWETAKGMSRWNRYPRMSANGFGIVRAGAPRGVTVAIRIAAYNKYGVGPYGKTRNVQVKK